MSMIALIMLGALAGCVASLIMRNDFERSGFMNVQVGISGALFGGALFRISGASGVSDLNSSSFFVAVLAAVLLIAIHKTVSSDGRPI